MSIKKVFNKYLSEDEFIKLSYEGLKEYGFNRDNTIAGLCLCRDEICQSVLLNIKEWWGEVFNFSTFAGVYTLGQLGLKVFISHCPETKENKKCVFYVFSHIGIDENGNTGICKRKGIEKSTACGALILLHNEISNKTVKSSDNIEINYIRERLTKEISHQTPTLLDLSNLVLQVNCKDIENAMEILTQQESIDYAIISGIQVHYMGRNLIVPKDVMLSLANKKIKLNLY